MSQLAVGQASSADSAGSAGLTYHSSTSEVRLVFFPTDDQHHPIRELQPDDFAVIDDDRVIRQFHSLTRSLPLKLDLVVLLDASGSVLPHFQQEIADVSQMLSQWPWLPGDRVSVLSFSGMDVRLICAGNCRTLLSTQNASQPATSLPTASLPQASLPQGGATPLFDALDSATTLILERRQADAWPVIILLSDGVDTISRASLQDVREKMFASEAQIYTIDIRTGQPDMGTTMLQRLADDSGGRYLRIADDGATNLRQVMNDVVEDLHSARVVTYALPESSSTFHSVRILPTRNLTWQFRSRRGYYSHAENGQ